MRPAIMAFAFISIQSACAHAGPVVYKTRTGEIIREVPCSSMIKIESEVSYVWFNDNVLDAVVMWHRWLRIPVFYTKCQECQAELLIREAVGLVGEDGKRLVGLFDPIGWDNRRGCWNKAYLWVDSETAYGPSNFLTKTLAHELGHAVGIDDSDNRYTIMRKSIRTATMTLPSDEMQIAYDTLNMAAAGGPIPSTNTSQE